jgi:hypothetical protein
MATIGNIIHLFNRIRLNQYSIIIIITIYSDIRTVKMFVVLTIFMIIVTFLVYSFNLNSLTICIVKSYTGQNTQLK